MGAEAILLNRSPARWRARKHSAVGACLAVLSVVAVGCATSNAVDDEVIQVEEALAARVAPVLDAPEEPQGDEIWHIFDDTLASVRSDDLHVVRGPEAGASSGSSHPHTLESIVTVVGEEKGACLAVWVDSADVMIMPVAGEPADNCRAASIPDRR